MASVKLARPTFDLVAFLMFDNNYCISYLARMAHVSSKLVDKNVARNPIDIGFCIQGT